MCALGSGWYKGVNPNLDRLAQLLGRAKPSHGYTIAEKAPEVVTAPGIYFPAEKGEVIPLESRQYGGDVEDPYTTSRSSGGGATFTHPFIEQRLGSLGDPFFWTPRERANVQAFSGLAGALKEQSHGNASESYAPPPQPDMDIQKTETTETIPAYGPRDTESVIRTQNERRRRLYDQLFPSREKGGPVSPGTEDTLPKDNERAKLQMLSKILSMVKPAGLETKAGMGMAIPPEPMKMEQSKYDILKSAISILKPPAQAKGSSSSTSKDLTETAKKPRPAGTGEASTGLNETGTKLSPTGEPTPLDRTNQYLRQMTTMFSRADGGGLTPATFEDPEEERKRRIIETDLNLQREPLGMPERTIPTEEDRKKEVLAKSVNNDTRGIARDVPPGSLYIIGKGGAREVPTLDEFNRVAADQNMGNVDKYGRKIADYLTTEQLNKMRDDIQNLPPGPERDRRYMALPDEIKLDPRRVSRIELDPKEHLPQKELDRIIDNIGNWQVEVIRGRNRSIATPQGEIPIEGTFAGLPFLGGKQVYKTSTEGKSKTIEQLVHDSLFNEDSVERVKASKILNTMQARNLEVAATQAGAVETSKMQADKAEARTVIEQSNLVDRLLKGQTSPSQISQSFRQPWVRIMAVGEAIKRDPNYNEIQADANARWYETPTTQRLIRRTESIVAPGGAADEAIRFAKLVNNPAGTPINRLSGKAKVAFGNSKRSLLDLVQGISSEEIQQIMGAQGGGERFLQFTQALNDPNLSVEQYVNNVKELKYLIYTRQVANVRGTPEQEKWDKWGNQLKKEKPFATNSETGIDIDAINAELQRRKGNAR